MSRARLFGRQDLPPQNCAHCGKRMVIGIMLSVMINGKKFRVCSFECEDALKESRSKEATV